MPSVVSCTGISSSTVTTCTAVFGDLQQRHHADRLVAYRPHPGQGRHLGVDVEESGDPAGRRRVEHDGVVQPAATAALAGGGLHDLAAEQHVAHARARWWWRSRSRRSSSASSRPGAGCRTARDIRSAPAPGRPRGRRPRHRHGRPPRAAPRTAAAGCRRAGRCLDVPRPRSGAPGGPPRRAPGRALPPPWSCRCRPSRSRHAA